MSKNHPWIEPVVLSIMLLAPALGLGATPASAPPRPVAYKLDQPGRVSLAIYDPAGRQVRTLLNAAPQAKGRNEIAWDGLDGAGRPVTNGTYNWKLLQSQGLQAEYLTALGTSSGLNHWPGQHGGPATVACDGRSVIVGGAPEGSPLLASVTLDGQLEWNRGQFAAPEGAIDTAIDGDRVYSLQSSTAMHVLERATGNPLLQTNHQAITYRMLVGFQVLDPIAPSAQAHVSREIAVSNASRVLVLMTVGQNDKSNARIGCKIQDAEIGFDGLKPGEQRTVFAPLVFNNLHPVEPHGGKLNLTFTFQPSAPGAEWFASELKLYAPCERIDARAGALAGLFPAADTLAWIEPDTGRLLEQVKIAQARDLTLLDAQTALVISGADILQVSRQGEARTAITGLRAPTRLAWDSAAQTLWVAEAGTSQQIKRFGPDFKLQATLGRPGGRRMGLYKPEDFLAVADIAADGHGGFVICESDSAPRRTAHFDRAGKLLREWYGGQQFYTFAAADPDDPTLVWMDSQWGHLMQVKVDYVKRDWTVRACYRWDEKLHPMLFSNFKMARRMVPFRADLKGTGQLEQFLWSDAHAGLILKVDETAGVLRPVAGLGSVTQGGSAWDPITADESQLPPVWLKTLRDIGMDLNQHPDARRLYRGFGWADTNDSCEIGQGKMVLYPSTGHGFSGHPGCLFMDTDYTLYAPVWGGKDNHPLWMAYPAQGRTPSGAPIWDWGKATVGPMLTGKAVELLLASLRRDPAGNTYTIMHGGGDGYAAMGTYNQGAHGCMWPANQIDANAVVKWDKEGRELWRVGPHAARHERGNGRLQHPTYLAGVVNGAIGVCDKIINPCEFWSEDGLYIGGLFDRRAEDGLPARAYAWWRGPGASGDAFDNLAALQYDMILGGSLTKLPNGDVIFFGCGWNNVPVYRVTGWDQIRRQQGTVNVTSPAPNATGDGQGLAAEYFSKPDFSGEPVRKIAPRLWFEPSRQGFGWPTPAAAARWTGMLEPRFSEAYTLSVYAKGNVRLWMGGKLVVDVANKGSEFHKVFTDPVPLSAGQRYAIKAEWVGPGDGEFHLNWESTSQPIEHVPMSALHLEPPRALPVVSVYPSANRVTRPVPSRPGAEVEWIVARKGATNTALSVQFAWGGSAVAGRDYQALPAVVTIPVGRAAVLVPMRLLAVDAIAPTRALVAMPAITSQYVIEGTRAASTLAIRDPRLQPLKVAGVTVTGKHGGPPFLDLVLNEHSLGKLIDGSGLDRKSDPPVHDANIANAWWAAWIDPDQTVLTFDLGALCAVAEVQVWNLNSRSCHGGGWGDGPTVRDAPKQIRILTSESSTGPWADCGQSAMHEPPGNRPDAGDLLPIGQRARYVQMRFSRPHETATLGLAEVEFRGAGVAK